MGSSEDQKQSVFPDSTAEQVLNCSYDRWYPLFTKHAPASTIIDLPDEFIAYLAQDGMYMPVGSESFETPTDINDGAANSPLRNQSLDTDVQESRDPESSSDSGSDAPPIKRYQFTELDDIIRKTVKRYDGAVFPKLNWTSPQDAAWAGFNNSLKCDRPSEVYILLKASDFVSHDIDYPWEGCTDNAAVSRSLKYKLVLKKWYDIPQSQEFRCFIRQNQLIAISQRDPNYYPFLQDPSKQAEITGKIVDFWDTTVRSVFPNANCSSGPNKFPTPIDLNTDVMDVYITRNNQRIFIMDFNPYMPRTDSLLFGWQELSQLASERPSRPILRVIQSATNAGGASRYMQNTLPLEFTALGVGKTLEEYQTAMQKEVAAAMKDTDHPADANDR